MDAVIAVIALLVVVPGGAFVFGYLFLLKMMSHMQSRLGPMEAGPHGVLQLLADGIKFVGKEDLIPARADRLVFGIAPIVIVVSTFALFIVIPAGPGLVIENYDIGVLYVIAIASLSTIGILMAGWASASKYSLLGGLRAAAQLLAYEIPLVLAALGVIVQAGSMSLVAVTDAQADTLWFVVPQIVGFVLFLIAAQAELTQTPFDMPVAETEIVTGYQTEYSGFRFLLFYIGETATAVALSALAVTLYLGGWHVPFLDLDGIAAKVVGAVVFSAKTLAVAAVMFWVRFSLPRLREDQLQSLAWKVLVPLGLLNLALTAVFKVAW